MAYEEYEELRVREGLRPREPGGLFSSPEELCGFSIGEFVEIEEAGIFGEVIGIGYDRVGGNYDDTVIAIKTDHDECYTAHPWCLVKTSRG